MIIRNKIISMHDMYVYVFVYVYKVSFDNCTYISFLYMCAYAAYMCIAYLYIINVSKWKKKVFLFFQ